MKGRILSVLLIFALSVCFLASCAESKKAEFNHCELTLVLDKGYEQEKSEDFFARNAGRQGFHRP